MSEPEAASRSAVHGLVLAAGAGTRYGRPKALVVDPAGASETDTTPDPATTADPATTGTAWIERAVSTLLDGGCDAVTVALGASADAASALIPPVADELRVEDWAEGLSATLRAGLLRAARSRADAVVIVPVDTPAMPADAVRRVIHAAAVDVRTALVQAVYDGMPGHPVLIGADHLEAIAAELRGDRGARRALVARGVRDIECGDLWDGADTDTPR